MRPRPVHLVGIGGAGMSGIARLAAAAGYRVSGTDREESPALDALRAAGIDARAGHAAAAVPPDAASVVVSTAVGEDAPDLVAARARGIPIVHRSELLAELMRGHRGLAVAGAHGKSTTSAMLMRALGDSSGCVGATVPGGEGTGAVWGEGPFFVAEADESDRSLLNLRPEAAILLNVDHDHHATFAGIEEVEAVFAEFLGRLPADGVVVTGPDARALGVAAAAPCPLIRIGIEGLGELWVEPGDPPILAGADGGRHPLRLAAPGRHNLENAACAIALAEWCGVDRGLAAERLAGFSGVGRRFELRGEAGGVRVVDDYAHHPAEVAATLRAARETGPARIIAIFQPHLYSRTRALGAELGAALGEADLAIVTPVYAAREAPEPGVGAELVTRAVPGGRGLQVDELDQAVEAALALARPGDLILTLGAGDVTRLGQELVGRLGKQTGDGGDHPADRPGTT